MRTLYICDGKACKDPVECYVDGGSCYHTEKELHAISRKDPKFPATEFRMEDGNLVEHIESSSLKGIEERSK